jgi:hypothetical protein
MRIDIRKVIDSWIINRKYRDIFSESKKSSVASRKEEKYDK